MEVGQVPFVSYPHFPPTPRLYSTVWLSWSNIWFVSHTQPLYPWRNMLVVLKYTVAVQPCKRSSPAQSTGAAQGTGMEQVGETEGEEIDWGKTEWWVERRNRWKVVLDKGLWKPTSLSCNTRVTREGWCLWKHSKYPDWSNTAQIHAEQLADQWKIMF